MRFRDDVISVATWFIFAAANNSVVNLKRVIFFVPHFGAVPFGQLQPTGGERIKAERHWNERIAMATCKEIQLLLSAWIRGIKVQ